MEHQDERASRAERVEHLRRAIGFDAHVWLLTDPITTVGASPLADVPCLSELPRLIRFKYLTEVNRWNTLGQEVATLRTVTEDDPARSLVWREVQSAYDVGDVASLAFQDGHGCWGFLDLWRSGQEARFTSAEVTRLQRQVAPLTAHLRRAVAATFGQPVHASVSPGPAVLVLSPELEVRAQTAESDALLRALLPTVPVHNPVPAAAYNVAAQLLAQEAGVDLHPASARVHASSGTWLTLRAARVSARTAAAGTETAHIGAADSSDVEADIVVTIEVSTAAERAELFTRAHALTARETQVVGLLLGGSDTQDVATRMFISQHTVQDHLKSVFAKTGLHTRRAIVAHVAG